MLYRFFRVLAKVALGVFFRQVEVEGRQNVPADGSLLFVANHANALVDPLLIVVALRRRVTVTAKNVLAKNPLLALLMKGLGVVTFHRREDVGKGAEPRENVRSLRQCREVLAKGGAICIFPEGVSHSDPQMRPFRTGPARIALDFLRQNAGGSLSIVPVGLLYTEKDRFRSGAWLRFAPPLDVAAWQQEHPEAGTRELTDEIRRRVESVTMNYGSAQEALLLSWAADIMATRGEWPRALGQDGRDDLAQWFGLLHALQDDYRSVRESHAQPLEALTERIRRYRGELARRGIDPAEVYLPIHWGRASLFLAREAELVVVGSPLAAFGILNHILPYQMVKWIARKLSTDRDHWASNTVYPGFLVFPFFYALQLAVAWLLLPAFWAALYSVALPFTGYYALLYRDRIGSSWRRTRTFFHWLRHPSEQIRFTREGREIMADIERLRTAGPARPTTVENVHVG